MIKVIRLILEILKQAFGYAKETEKTQIRKQASDRRDRKLSALDKWLQSPSKIGQHEEASGDESRGIQGRSEQQPSGEEVR